LDISEKGMNHNESSQSVPSDAYTREYYETCCHGYEEFKYSRGGILPLRLKIPLETAQLERGLKVVDIGSGRGELVLHCAEKGAWVWGIDYAAEAFHLVKEAIEDMALGFSDHLGFQQGDARLLPFANGSVDVVFMLDIVEHLYSEELENTFGEVWRILVPGGRLIVHTMPNLWYYRYGYPIYRSLQRLRGVRLPINPRDRWSYSHVHVNEQNPRQLLKTMRKSNFQTKVWLQTTQSYEYEKNSLLRFGMGFLTRWYPFRLIFCNDIFALGIKK
jgi:cyclopropane fatty-acyl-phospholipid synthase-like methyltransferase